MRLCIKTAKSFINGVLAELGCLEPLRRAKQRAFGQRIARDRDRSGKPVDLDSMYGRDGFEWRSQYVADYVHFAEVLLQALHPESVIDLGCANALMINALRRHQVKVAGVEGSCAAFEEMSPEIRDAVLQWDLRKLWTPDLREELNGRWDVVVCTEVAEHLEPEYEDVFLSSVVSCVGRALVISWSPDWDRHRGTPLQEHWNPRTKGYVKRKLGSHGLRLDRNATRDFARQLETGLKKLTWWTENIMVFGKCD